MIKNHQSPEPSPTASRQKIQCGHYNASYSIVSDYWQYLSFACADIYDHQTIQIIFHTILVNE